MINPERLLARVVLLLSLILAFSSVSRSQNSLEEFARRRLGHVQELRLELRGARVVLQGKVKSFFEKRDAERQLLRLRGVASVDNRLTVQSTPRTDAQVKTDVNTVLLAQAWINPRKVVVKVNKSVVTLNGSVDRLVERDWIEDIAGSVRGVRDVINQIKVSTPEAPLRSNESVRQDIEAALGAELGEAARRGLAVEVSNGVVALRGAVRNYYEKVGAYQAASSVPDVIAVKNFIEIE